MSKKMLRRKGFDFKIPLPNAAIGKWLTDWLLLQHNALGQFFLYIFFDIFELFYALRDRLI